MPGLPPLPVDAVLADLREHLRVRRAAVLVAAPGAGKTTRVPPALAADGPVLVLQPRRAAARALARRVADQQQWLLGREVGWHVRFEPRFCRETRVLFATEGILTARLQQDPLLSDITTVILDEFHERSVHADLGLALVREAWLARRDLRVVVMSATIDPGPVSRFLDDCPVIDVPGEPHPIVIEYAPDLALSGVLDRVLRERDGDVLCFLPGAREIDQAAREIAASAARHGVQVRPLHGTLPADAQDDALTPGTGRRVVLATNIAETSVTVPGVRTVIDSGWQKVARYDTARALDTLQTERVSADAADQRAGRAARLGPGLAVRLWPERDKLRPFREPDIARIDLAPVLLAILAWGGDIASFGWFEAPALHRQQEARQLLERLGALAGTGLAPMGRVLARLPLPPRLARMVVDAGGHPDACLLAALLSDGRPLSPDGRTAASDLPALVPAARLLPHIRRAAEAVQAALADRDLPTGVRANRRSSGDALDEETLCKAMLAGFPDRVAQRRTEHGDSLLLATGTGARLSPASGVRNADWLVALELRGNPGRESVVHLASGIQRDWLAPTHSGRQVSIDTSGRLRATLVRHYDALTLREQPDALRPEDRLVLVRAWHHGPRGPRDQALLARLAFAAIEVDVDSLLLDAAASATSLAEIDLAAALPWHIGQRLLTDAPERLPLPSGRTASLIYGPEGGVRAAVKLQELFGLAETPRLGPARTAVTFELLAPNGRAVQTTQDLRSFWTTTYADVRRQLRARYPRHPWPEDPWTATPTHRTTRR